MRSLNKAMALMVFYLYLLALQLVLPGVFFKVANLNAAPQPPTLWEVLCSSTDVAKTVTVASCQAHAAKQLNVPCQCNDTEVENLLRHCLVARPALAPAHCPKLLHGRNEAPPQQHSIAFSIVAHRSALDLLRLVDAIWRPHHHICIHVDAASSSSEALRAAVEIIVARRPNVLRPHRSVRVGYGAFGRIDAELACLDLLLAGGREWDSFINLSGQEYPLHSMQWIERSVAGLRGRPDVEYVPEAGALTLPQMADNATRESFARFFPHGLLKGSGYVVLSRSASQRLRSSTELGLLRRLFTDVFVRDDPFERVYTTLLQRWRADDNDGEPPAAYRDYAWKAKYVQWGGEQQNRCYGKAARGTHPCVLAIGDLPRLISRNRSNCGEGGGQWRRFTPVCAADGLFANKMDSDVDSLLVECLRIINSI